MIIIIGVVFLSVFAVAFLVGVGTATRASRDAEMALSRLDSALAGDKAASSQVGDGFLKKNSFSEVPWIDRLLKQFELAPRVQLLLAQADSKWSTGFLLLSSSTSFAVTAYVVNWKTGSLALSLAAGMALGFVPFVIVLLKRAKRFSKFEEQLPGALGLVVSALRVGHSLNAALGLIARQSPQPIAGEFKICFDEQNFGLELRTAFENLLARIPLKDLKIVVTAILVQKESGGNLAEVLTNTAHVIRERFRLKRQVKTHTAQGRLTGWILCFLPIVLGCALYVVNPETMRLLWTRAIGIKLLYAASGMVIIGSLIINKIVKMEV